MARKRIRDLDAQASITSTLKLAVDDASLTEAKSIAVSQLDARYYANSERGFASVATPSDRAFATTNGTWVQLQITTGNNILSASNFTRTATAIGPAITYTGAVSAAIRLSANFTFSGSNGDSYEWAFYKNGSTIGSSETSVTLSHSNGHQVVLETFLIANTNDAFTIFVRSLNGNNTITITSISFNAHTL